MYAASSMSYSTSFFTRGCLIYPLILVYQVYVMSCDALYYRRDSQNILCHYAAIEKSIRTILYAQCDHRIGVGQ